jgi:hypothetical protein
MTANHQPYVAARRGCAGTLADKMNDRDKEAAARIEAKYRATVTSENRSLCVTFPGIAERFHLSTEYNEYTISGEAWHEHLPDLTQLETFLDGIFSGAIRIVVKFRGKTPVGHQVQKMRDGRVDVTSRTGSLVPFFWRNKSFKTMEYRTANNGTEPIR